MSSVGPSAQRRAAVHFHPPTASNFVIVNLRADEASASEARFPRLVRIGESRLNERQSSRHETKLVTQRRRKVRQARQSCD